MTLAIAIMLRIFFPLLVLHHIAAVSYAQDDQSGFISIDCGSRINYTQDRTGIYYVLDDGFIEGGVSHDLSGIHNYFDRVYNSLRSFPENKRNCYTLRPQKGKNNRYLIRAMFFYGDYSEGQPPVFDLYIGADYWDTVRITDPSEYFTYEIIHLASSDYIHVCLVNTGNGDPFITSLELRLLDINLYKDQSGSLLLDNRYDFGSEYGSEYLAVRYKDDKYDRVWEGYFFEYYVHGFRGVHASEPFSLGPKNEEQVPLKVMSTAITPINSTGEISYWWHSVTNVESIVYIYLAEVEKLEIDQKREFNIHINDTWLGTFSPSTNITTIRRELSLSPSNYELRVTRTLNSTLPPIINALEIYTLKQLLQEQTDDQDVAAIRTAKSTYGFTELRWQGDPCFPHAWDGLNCNNSAPGPAKIISLNLSSRGLNGEIASALANLTMIESLDLSYNDLTGNVPKFLAHLDNLRILNLTGNKFTRPLPAELLEKSKKGLLLLSIEESSGGSCLEGSCSNNNHKMFVILTPIIGCIVVLSIIIVIVFLVNQLKKKALIKREEVLTPRKQQFTYSEVVVITKNFQNEIGRGGFGRVFRGSVGGKEVAVKMLSESSSQGYKEFQVEVKLLMEIHHTNVTSLVGYCDDSNHKGIIYEFMANGNLEKHIFEGGLNVLSWERRLQIGLDAAEGLAYMHHGCRPPILHRDVKCSNILLTEGFKAKLTGFGLSRAFPTKDASYVLSEKIAGTAWYLDTELAEKSDVYSFGVVLMELITSRRAISEGFNLINWVKSAIEEGNIENIIDCRLDGRRFDINTAWKVVEIAIACVSPTSIKRPSMNDVVIDLKQCLESEKTCRNEPMSLNLDSVSNPHPR